MSAVQLSEEDLKAFSEAQGESKLNLLFELTEKCTKAFIDEGCEELSALSNVYSRLENETLQKNNLNARFLYEAMEDPDWQDSDLEQLWAPGETEIDFLKSMAEHVLDRVDDFKSGNMYEDKSFIAALVDGEYISTDKTLSFQEQEKQLREYYQSATIYKVILIVDKDEEIQSLEYKLLSVN